MADSREIWLFLDRRGPVGNNSLLPIRLAVDPDAFSAQPFSHLHPQVRLGSEDPLVR
jgi:hypothetical protein